MAEVLQDFPAVSVDMHIRNVPDFENVYFDARRYGKMLIDLGVPPENAGSRNHIYIRPDYELAYTRSERVKKFLSNPWDYTDAGSCVINEEGGVDIVIVYKSGYGVNKLLRHETHRAVKMLTQDSEQSHSLFSIFRRVILAKKIATQEEKDANRLMKNRYLKSKYKKIIKIERSK